VKTSVRGCALLSVIVLLGACITSTSRRNPKYHLPPTDPWQVVFLPGFPNVPILQLGSIDLKGAPAASWNDVLWKARQDAAAMGGDAMVILLGGESYAGTYQMPGSYYGTTTGQVSATANSAYGTANTTGTWVPGPSIALQRKSLVGIVIRAKGSVDDKALVGTTAPGQEVQGPTAQASTPETAGPGTGRPSYVVEMVIIRMVAGSRIWVERPNGERWILETKDGAPVSPEWATMSHRSVQLTFSTRECVLTGAHGTLPLWTVGRVE